MIQVNLLPDVKREYLRSQQMKHAFTVGSVLITFVAVGLVTFLFAYVQFVQPRHLSNLQKDIDEGITEMQGKDNAVRMVTVQGVLEQVPALQDKKLITSRLFKYLVSFTPNELAYSEVNLDLAANTLTLTGQTISIERANILSNNLKSANFEYQQNDASQNLKPFTNIEFKSLSRNDQADSPLPVNFQITFAIDQSLFNQTTKQGVLKVDAGSDQLLLPTAVPFSEVNMEITQ